MSVTESRELMITHTFNVSVERVWEAWTNPDQIIHWWGPDGFTTTIHEMNLRAGGEWKLTLHGPDGTNFPNRSIYKEIIPNKKIEFEHFNPHFITTVIFSSLKHKTVMEWTMLFDSIEMWDVIVKAHKAGEGLKQNIQKLERYLS